MANTTKENLMQEITAACVFSNTELKFIEESIEAHKELGGEAVLKLGTLNEMEAMGILQKFYDICEKNHFFPKWIENVKNGLDHI